MRLHLVVTWIANSLAIYAVAYLMESVAVASLADAFLAGAVLSIVNAVVKPIVVILTLPLTIVTLGLFYFVVTASCLYLASLVVPGFLLQGFWSTVLASILVSLFSALIARILHNASGSGQSGSEHGRRH
jgi:putative membrane protein